MANQNSNASADPDATIKDEQGDAGSDTEEEDVDGEGTKQNEGEEFSGDDPKKVFEKSLGRPGDHLDEGMHQTDFQHSRLFSLEPI